MHRTIKWLIVFLAVALAVTACFSRTPPSTPTPLPATPEPVAYTGDGAANPDAIVDTAWIVQHLSDDNVRLLDVSSNEQTYNAGHLPGALFLNWSSDLTNPADPVRSQILTQAQLSQVMSRLGVENDDTIVLYDGSNNLYAARAFWALKYYRHNDVKVYNGGSKKWRADGRSLVTVIPQIIPSRYVAADADPSIRTTSEYLLPIWTMTT